MRTGICYVNASIMIDIITHRSYISKNRGIFSTCIEVSVASLKCRIKKKCLKMMWIKKINMNKKWSYYCGIIVWLCISGRDHIYATLRFTVTISTVSRHRHRCNMHVGPRSNMHVGPRSNIHVVPRSNMHVGPKKYLFKIF